MSRLMTRATSGPRASNLAGASADFPLTLTNATAVGRTDTSGWSANVGIGLNGTRITIPNATGGYVYQDIALTAEQQTAVNDGTYKAEMTFNMSSFASDNDAGALVISCWKNGAATDTDFVCMGSLTFENYSSAGVDRTVDVWVPRDQNVDTIRCEFVAARFSGSEASVYLGDASAILKRQVGRKSELILSRRSDVTGLTTTSGPAATTIVSFGKANYPGVGSGSGASAQYEEPIVDLSSLSSDAQTQVAAGNAEIILSAYIFNENDDDRGRYLCIVRDNLDVETTRIETAATTVDYNSQGQMLNPTPVALPTDTDDFRAIYAMTRADGTFLDAVVANATLLLEYDT